MWMSAQPAAYSTSDSSSVSSCDHSTLNPTFCASMHGRGIFQAVEDLDGLQLENARSAQPGERDVLRELRVRPGGRPDARRGANAVVRDGEVEPLARAAPNLARFEVVDRAGAGVLDEHAT